MTEGPLAELRVEAMTHGGDGLARDATGRVVFVRGALPGEEVTARITETHAQYARAVLHAWPRLASPDRLEEPPCAEFGRWPERGRDPHRFCGACHWQHIAYEAQLRYKADILREALCRQGAAPNPPVQPAVDPGAPWRYRNHLRLRAMAGRLAFVAADGRALVPVGECPIADPRALALATALEGELPPGLAVELRVGASAGDALIVFGGNDEALDDLVFETDLDVSVVIARSDGRLEVAAGHPYLVEVLGDRPFVVPATAFFQTNTRAAEAIVSLVRAAVPTPVGTIADLYSGVGTFAVLLADRADRLYAVESNPHAVAAAVENASGLDNLTLVEGTAAEGLAYIEPDPDIAVVDPPRTGMDRRTIGLLTERVRGTIVYVSCDAVTHARDARSLCDSGWTLERCTPVDMFPQSHHIECVSIFTRTGDV